MIEIKYTGDALWERIERAVEKVKDRLRRVARALNSANIPYAVIGGNAVQHWVSQVDESVVRNTRDVDIILNESDLDRAIAALATEGFIYRRSAGVTSFRTVRMPRLGMPCRSSSRARRCGQSTRTRARDRSVRHDGRRGPCRSSGWSP